MKKLLLGLFCITFAILSFGQEDQLNTAAANLAMQLAGKEKNRKVFAVSFFTNSQGYGSHYSDYIADALSGALTRQGLTLVTRNRFAQIIGEQNLSATKQFDAKWVQQAGKFASADAIFGGTYEVKDNDVRITIQLLDVLSGTILLAPEVIRIPRTKEVDEELNPTPVKHLNDVAVQIGLNAIEFGKYKTEEDQRFILAIKNARNIKALFVNGDNIFQTFKNEFQQFLLNPASSMQVLLGTADSDFYREETEMTKLDSNPNDPAFKANQMKVEFNRQRLVGLASDPSQVQFKYFNTQYRLPIIIMDDKSCFLTLRLSPNESQQSVRLEFEGGEQGFAQSCVAHFNRMWAVSSVSPDKKSR